MKAHAYRGRASADVVTELDADGAGKSVDESLGLTAYELDDGSVVAVYGGPRAGYVRAFSNHESFCLSVR